MRLLHLSDIHFSSPVCLTPHLDTSKPFRSRLEHDLAKLCHADGKRVDAILVGGDIAYKADPAEYEAAKTWLLHIAEICGCKKSNILMVPGKHDVDWTTCGRADVAEAQAAIADEADNSARNRALMRQLATGEDAKSLFEPLTRHLLRRHLAVFWHSCRQGFARLVPALAAGMPYPTFCIANGRRQSCAVVPASVRWLYPHCPT